MTTRFRLDLIHLDTDAGPVDFTFPSDLTVLAGPTGVGKTTLLELVKFGLGGSGLLAPVAQQHIDAITVEVVVGEARLRLRRSLDPRHDGVVSVTDLRTQEDLGAHGVGAEQPNVSSLLLTAMGLPADMRAAARTASSRNTGARITFNDVFTFMYIPQAEINRDIASSQDNYREPKRKAVFELLFGLTNPEILDVRSGINHLNDEISTVEREHDTILTFLQDTNTAARVEVEHALAAAVATQQRAHAERERLRESVEPVQDRETRTLRDLLTDAERGVAAAHGEAASLARQRAEYADERRRLEGDLTRLRRMREAGARLANIEFRVCPRCMQSVADREVPAGACSVCLQPDPLIQSEPAAVDTYEERQLTEQLTEVDDQLDVIDRQIVEVDTVMAARRQLVADLSADVDRRTADRVSPRLQAFDDLAQELARAQAEQQQLEAVLRQWDRADDIGQTASRLRAEREDQRAQLDAAERALDARRGEVLDDLDAEFRDTVANLGIPGIETVSIHRSNYLPLLNGQPFSAVSSAGGIITATQVAYWSSLLTVAIRRRDTPYPAFLLIDSPRLALNTAEDLAAALYRRLVTQADANPGQLQIILADNELPAAYRRDYAEIDFTYERPTVSTVRHPGPANVQTLMSANGELL